MELLPIGPVLFIDTAGIDDVGALGTQRVERSRRVIDRTEVALLVVSAGAWSAFEQQLLAELQERATPTIVVFNKSDLGAPDAALRQRLQDEGVAVVETNANTRHGVDDLRQALIGIVPDEFINTPTILGDLVPAGGLVVLVVPIDKEAPKGRLILPQVQSIRDLLDNDAYALVVKEHELRDAFNRLKQPPDLVVTDSQAFLKVHEDTPHPSAHDVVFHSVWRVSRVIWRPSLTREPWPLTICEAATAY